MQWICFDENASFSLEASDLEQAEKLAARYEAKVLGPANSFGLHAVPMVKSQQSPESRQ